MVSATTALKETMAALPSASVAVRVTAVGPVPERGVPGTGTCVTTGAASQLSTAAARAV
jgi:hypothetical protein